LKPPFCKPSLPVKTFVLFFLFQLSAQSFSQDEYSFDISAYDKSPFEFNGYAELRWEHMSLNRNSALYLLNYYGLDERDSIDRYTASLQLEGRYRLNNITTYIRLNPETYNDDLESDNTLTTHEAYFSWLTKPGLTVDLGKKLLKWGKGYAWNPVGFVERPKDPNEPDLAREGFTIVSMDWIKSGAGDLKTLAITPVYLPVTDDMNKDYGPEDDNFAAKIYLLYKDTDIDLMVLSDASRTARYGFDFSRSISTNFEIHGEWAYITDFNRRVLNSLNTLDITTVNIQNWLLGFRYLTEKDTTFIAEYYSNGAGYTESQMQDFYQLVKDAPSQPDPDLAIARARLIANAGYIRQTMMRKYIYLRIQQKEPFNILYWTPAITGIFNLEDNSYNVSPELVYTGVTNLELRIKLNLLYGDDYSEFGEKPNDRKAELRARYYF